MKYGDKIKFEGKDFFVDSVGKRTIKAFRLMDIGEDNPYGIVGHVKHSIPIKKIKR